MNPTGRNKSIKIGTRGSKLALWQANWVKSTLSAKHPALEVELVIIKTKGDKILDVPLAKIGGKGLFVKEIETSLLNGSIDIAVHSMKDMPADIPGGLCISAIPKRENPYDVLISKNNISFSKLAPNASIGTSSLRRASQLLHIRPDIEIKPLRGNLDTRLKKLDTEHLDGIILAAAGIKRLDFEDRISEYLDENVMLPAVGQGALCIETRENDPEIASLMVPLDHKDTRPAVLAERALLNRLEGGCQVPIAALGTIENDTLLLKGLVADIDGKTLIKKTLSGPKHDFNKIGVDLAGQLLSAGAGEILNSLKAGTDEHQNG